MKQREKENLICCSILTALVVLLLCWICPTQGVIPDEHEPCSCDTCCEYHYENIRAANPGCLSEID